LIGIVSQNSLPASRSPTVHTEQPISPPIAQPGAGRWSARAPCREEPRPRRPPGGRTVRTGGRGSHRNHRAAVAHRQAEHARIVMRAHIGHHPHFAPRPRTSPRWTAG
jgi:hypothetical protein